MKQHHSLHRNRLLIFLNTAAFFVFAFAVAGLYYETNDDATLSNIAGGAFGPNTQDLIYINILLGWLLRGLYTLLPGINHLVLIQLLGVFVSIAAILSLLVKRHGPVYGLLLGSLIFIPFSVELISKFQYVKTSTVIILAGLLLIADNLARRSRSLLLGYGLAVLGCMLRFESFFAVGALTAFTLLHAFFQLDRRGKQAAVLRMAVLFCLVFTAEGLNTLYYSRSDQWQDFYSYNQARTTLSDYKENYLPDYSQQVQALGLSENDLQMLYTRNFYDNTVFSTETIETVNAAIPAKTGAATAADFALVLSLMFRQMDTWLYRMSLILILLCLVSCRRRAVFYQLGTVGMFLLLLLYLLAANRYMSRLEVLLLAALTVNVVMLYQPRRTVRHSLAFLPLCLFAVLLVCLPAHCRYQRTYSDYRQQTLQYHEAAVLQMSQSKENLYLFDPTQTDSFAGANPLQPRPAGFFSNICPTGSWYSNCCYTNDVLARYGLQSPLIDSVNNPNVFISNAQIEIKLQYVREHYNPAVYAVKVTDNGLCDYQFRLD